MYVVGITGGIGSGKSAATERFESLGITVVDADVISRIIVEPGRPALAAIADHFGEDILQSDGTLDRARLRTLVFNSPEERSWLEQLTHPLIGEEIVTQLTAAKSPYVMLSSPLLLETSQAQLTDLVIVVDVPVDVQVQRTMARDDNDEAQVRRIIDAQMPRKDRLARADIVIDNNQSLAALGESINHIHATLLSKAEAKEH
ncbi:dephospho-CoA kinase [Parahalioglobus pacificus]|uniref:Dephospho-CoA kinase n=1 Tax=Parahalioglobus pacificus TaxID=930806 RepID=A0A919CHI8_9GAMM|nr:dephospho-CoA kinase [Halioglobus pacificus]GHD26028.1 dephospho-CoA kinase [Halioglobus pacificus]